MLIESSSYNKQSYLSIITCELGPFAVMFTFILYFRIWQVNNYFLIGPVHKSANYSIFY